MSVPNASQFHKHPNHTKYYKMQNAGTNACTPTTNVFFFLKEKKRTTPIYRKDNNQVSWTPTPMAITTTSDATINMTDTIVSRNTDPRLAGNLPCSSHA